MPGFLKHVNMIATKKCKWINMDSKCTLTDYQGVKETRSVDLPRLNSLGHKIPVFFQIITLSCLGLDPVHPWYGFHHVSIYSSC